MITISKRLTSFVWHNPALSLADSFPWKSAIRKLSVIRATGAGYDTYTPGTSFNSLLTIPTGAILTLDAVGVVAGNQATYIELDNGDDGLRPEGDIPEFTNTFFSS